MSISLRSSAAAALALACSALLVACASASAPAAGGDAFGTRLPAPPAGDVLGQGTVLDDGAGPQLCLAGVMESYPPQCSGLPLDGWDWDAVEGWEEASGVRWGAYAVQGAYDGQSLAVTAPPILLALYDPMAPEDPTGGVPGEADEATLVQIQDVVHDRLGTTALASGPREGYLWVTVIWDDGTLQADADAEWGGDVVIVQSALTPVG